MQESYQGMPRSRGFTHYRILQTIPLVTIVHGGADNIRNVAFLQIMGAGLHTQWPDDHVMYSIMDEWLK